MESKIYKVEGMSCAGCAISVETILKKQEGVSDAGVNLSSNTVWINFDDKRVSPSQLRDAVRSMGYELIIDEGHEQPLQTSTYASGLKKDFLLSLALSIPTLVLSMFFMEWKATPWLVLILSTPIVFYFGKRFHRNALKQAKHLKANMDTLISLSTNVAYVYSLFTVIHPGFWLNRGITPHLYFESAAMIITFILLGKWLEERAKGKTASSIKKIMGLQPQFAWVKHKEGFVEVPLSSIAKGDVIMVKPGERVAVDGFIVSGNSWIDESSITGEPMPVEKKNGDRVWAGTINQNSIISIEAVQVGSESVLGKIIETVSQAQNSKASVQKIADRIAGVFVPAIILLSLLTLLTWVLLAPDLGFSHGVIAAITVLAIACPCALGLATPTAIMVGIGKAAQKNILIRDAESLELTNRVTTVVLDKTGTITEGRPAISSIEWFENETKYSSILKEIEDQSNHPLAKSISNYLNNIAAKPIFDSVEEIPGKGMVATIESVTYRVGNINYLLESGVNVPASASSSGQPQSQIAFSEGSRLIALITVSDTIKDSAKKAIENLKLRGIKVVMLTGDNVASAKQAADEIGIDEYKAELLPAGKSAYIRECKKNGEVVAMVGDGINDTEALSIADVSIAMGKGSDIAMDVAQVTILKSDLGAITELLTISKQTVRTIKQNLFWASIYNLLSIPIAAGVLYPLTGVLLDPMIAALAMALSSVSVVTNSLLLQVKKI